MVFEGWSVVFIKGMKMRISELHRVDFEADPVATKILADGRAKKIKAEIAEMIDDEFSHLEDEASDFISERSAFRAEKFLERVLRGDEDAAMALLGNASDSDRYKIYGSDEGEPWPQLIHGRLSETNGIKMRRQIVEAHPDLIRNERIKDLEAVVSGLTKQVTESERALAELRMNNYHT